MRIRIRTSKIEIIHIAVAWILVSLAFSIAINMRHFAYYFIMALFTVGIGFVLHELGHKIVAQHFNCFARFKANFQMLVLMLLLSFTGIIIAAPGAVFISGNVDRRKNGIISLAGPLVNIIIGIIFFVLFMFFKVPFLRYGFMINSWLALFNLIPIDNFDGTKILIWNKKIYSFAIIIAAVLMFVSYF